MITFKTTVDGKPTPLARARAGKARVYEDKGSKQAKNLFALLAKSDGPATALDLPCSVNLCFGMGPPPKSWPKWKREAALRRHIRPSSKPDIDNLVKFVLDALNGLWWSDDARICELISAKFYTDKPFTAVSATWRPQPTRKQYEQSTRRAAGN